MKILAVETSTMSGSVALLEDERIVSEYLLNIEVTHSDRLMPALDRILKDTGFDLSQIDCFAVSLGPGSFTGLRIGLSTIKGLGLAVDKPVVGVPTLDVLAHNITFSKYSVCPLLDARKGEIYTSLYQTNDKEELCQVVPYQVLNPRDWLTFIKDKTIFLGEGLRVYQKLIEEKIKDLALFAPFDRNVPRASVVGKLSLKRLLKGDTDDLASLAPIYLRRSEAEVKWEEKEKKDAQDIRTA